VKLLKDGGDVVSGAGLGEEAGSGVLNVLQFFISEDGRPYRRLLQ